MKALASLSMLTTVALLTGCISEDEKKKIEQAGVDLNKLANQIIVTAPAADSQVSDASVIVRADIPSDVEAKSVTLLVDGVEVGKDDDGAPWEISWPAYYWGDGNKHSLLLKTVSESGVELRNEPMSVTVSELVGSGLSISGPSSVPSGDSVSITLTPVDQARSYTVIVNGVEAVSENNEFTLTQLNLGENEIRYRAILDNSSSEVFRGPLSKPKTINVETPVTPVVSAAQVEKTDDEYQITLNWEALGGAQEYQVNWKSSDNMIEEYSSDMNQLILKDIDMGSYQWSVRQKNTAGHWSEFSENQDLNVGVFRTQLGGSGDDRASKIIKSISGGYLVLAETSSREVSTNLQGSSDDWIIRLDEQGNVVHQYVESKPGLARFRDIFEADDGSIYLVGQDWDTNKALITKLNSEFEPVWENEVLYRPETISERYDFIAISEWSKKLYISAVEWGRKGNSTFWDQPHLHEVDPATGVVSAAVVLPEIPGLKFESIKAIIPQNDQLILSGYAEAKVSTGSGFFNEGVFVLRLGSSLQLVSSWNNVGDDQHLNFGDAISLNSGRVAVIGQSDAGGVAIASVNSDGSEYRSYLSNFDDNLYYGVVSNLVQIESGGVVGFLKNDSSDRYLLMEFSENLTPLAPVYLDELTGSVSAYGMTANKDNSITLLFGQGQNGYNNYDVVVQKIAPIK